VTDVLGLGQCSLDYLSVAADFPVEDRKLEVAEPLVQGGGPVATALVALARLGFPTTFLGRVGDDRFGAAIRDGLAAEGVEVSQIGRAHV
jgi:ribokinase